jgi:photosystem II stability/assembly factor-like uncharacterized protein
MKQLMKWGLFFLIFQVGQLAFAQLPPSFWKEVSDFPTQNPTQGNSWLMVHPTTQELYVGTLKEGIFKSANKGISWQQVFDLKDTAINKIIVGPQNYLYAIADHYVFRSVNNGTSWTRHDVGSDYQITDIEHLGNRLIVSTASIVTLLNNRDEFVGDGVYVSDDDGITWTQKNLGITFRKAITNLAVNSYDVVFASMASLDGLGGGLYYSTDAASTWNRVQQLSYITPSDTVDLTSIHHIHCLEVDEHDTLHLSFEGISINVSAAGNMKISVNDLFWNLPWHAERVRMTGYEWDNQPYHTLHFARHQQHRYSSLHTPLSTAIGGPYFQSAPQQNWARIPSGMLPVGYGYVKTFFAEDADGKVYASQIGDHKIFYSDTSARLNNVIPEPENKGIFVNLYPNPTSSILHISLQQNVLLEQVVIHNSIGVSIPAVISNGSIDVSALPNDIYYLTVITNKGNSSLRFIRNN